MDEPDIKVSVVGDSSSIDQTFAKVERGADKMADGVVKSSKKAADGLTGMGEGAEKGAESFNRAEGRMAASIKRVTLDLQTLGKTASEKIVAKIEMQGLDAAKMQPLIDKLRETERAAAQAKTAQEEMAEAVAAQANAHKVAAQAIADEQRAQALAQAQQQQFLKGLSSQADSIGKSASQMAELRAQQMGVSKEAAPMIARLREAEKGASGMGAAFSKAAGYIKLAIAGMAGFSIAGLVKDSTMLAARFETMGVVMNVAGNNAGYTRKEMAELELQMQKTGISMIGSREVLTSLATANIDLALSTKLARASQDLAVVGNINSTEALSRMVSGIKSGQVEVLKTLGLNLSFEASYQKLANTLGITKEALTEQQKTMARTNAVLEESVRYSGIYEESMTSAGKAIGSMSRLWEDFKVRAGDSFLPTLAAAVFSLTDALKLANEELAKAGSAETINSIGGGLAAAFKTVFETVIVMGANVSYVFSAIGKEIEGIIKQAGALATLDFEGAGKIRDALRADAEASRKAIDAFSDRIMEVGVKPVATIAGVTVNEIDRIAAGEASRKLAVQDAARANWSAIVEKSLSKQALLTKEIANIEAAGLAAGKSRKDIEDQIAAARAKSAGAGNNGAAGAIASLKARLIEEKALAAELSSRGTHTEKLNQYERQAAQIAQQMTGAMSARAKAQLEATKTLAEQVGAQVRANEEAKKFYDDREKYFASAADNISNIQLESQAIEDQIATYGLGKSAIEAMELARLREQKTLLMGFEGSEEQIAIIEREIEARQRLGAAMSAKETLDKQKKAWTEWENDVKQMFNRVGQSLTDAIFDGGKSGKDLLKGLFKGLTFNVLINPIMGALQGAVTNSMGGMLGLSNPGQGGAGSSGISAMNMLSMAKNAYSAFTGGITSSMSNSIGWLGQKLGSTAVSSFASGMAGFTALGTATGAAAAVPSLTGLTMGSGMAASMGSGAAGSLATGGTFGAGSSFAAALPVVGWIAAGMMANQSLYKQGWDANNGSMNTGVGAVFGGATGSIHKALEGLGMSGSMASLLSGSAITSRLFGMKNKEYGDTSIVGSLGASGFTGNMETPWSQKGGLFRSNKSGVQYGPVSGDMQNSLSSSFTLMQAGISAVAESVGVASDSLNFYSEQIKITLTSDAEKNQEIIANALAGIGERMVASLVPTIADYARESETASQTLQRLSLSLSTANIYLKQVQNTLLDVSLAGADAAAKLGDVFGGLDKMGEVTQAFYMVAYTEGERAAASLEGMSIALQSVGAAMPKSVRELREMALALDLTTDSGRAAYATLLTIAPEFAAVTEAMKRLAQEAGAALLESFASRGALVQAMAGAEDTALLADQISALQNSAAAATIDFARFAAGLDGFETDSFVAAISLAFKSIGERIKTLIGDIASERIAVRTAAQQITDPGAMAPDAIRRQIAGINTALPGNAGVVAAGVRLSAADAAAEQARRHEEAARNSYMPAKAAYDSGVSQAPTLQAQYDNLYSIIQGKEGEIAIPRKYSEGRKYVRDLQATMPALYEQLNQIGTALNQAKAASAQGGNVANLAAAYAQAVSASAQASAAANAAALDAKKSQTAYADSLQAFAIDAGKSVSKLSGLREETMRYYEAQKALADLMKNSAASIRQTAADYRFGQLDPEDQFKQLKNDFNKNYSMALSTDGDVLAGYADKLNSLINPMLAAAQDMFASDAQYNSFVAQVLARTESIAGRLDTLAPADYEKTSLGLLSQIDATLAALDESTRSAEAIITDAINASRDATVNGLRQIANALSGQPIAAFATGGYHTGGLRIVGENGPELEATGPSRIFSSSQTRAMLSGGNGNAEMVMELRALREEVSGLRAETRATASHTSKTARQLERMEIDGMLIRTDADTPIRTEVVA